MGNTNTKELEIGDILYDQHRWNGLIRYVVERKTPTQAVLTGNVRVKKELTLRHDNDSIWYANKIGEYGSMTLETTVLKTKYEIQSKRQKINSLLTNIYWDKTPIEQLDSVIDFLTPLQNKK